MKTESDEKQTSALAVSAGSGVRWTTFGRVAGLVVQFCLSVIAARVLEPDDYGLMGMAAVVIGFLQVFRDGGVGQFILRSTDESREALSTFFFFIAGVGVCLAAGLFLSAPVLAYLFGDPRVAAVVRVLSLTFVISAFGQVPLMLLTRRMAFKAIVLIELSTTLGAGALGVWLARTEHGVWSLVWWTMTSTFVSNALFFIASKWRPRFIFRFAALRPALAFGLHLTGFSFVSYFARKADDFIVGIFLGSAALGFYQGAYRFMMLPLDIVSGSLGRVLAPTLCQIQDNDRRLKRVFLRMCAGVAFVTFPMMTGMMAVAQPLVHVLLGTKWEPMVPLIWILAPVGMLQSIMTLSGHLYLVKARTDRQFRVATCVTVLLIASFFAGLHWGVAGVAAAYAIMYLIIAYPVTRFAYSVVSDLHPVDAAVAVLPYLIYAVVMGVSVYACSVAMITRGLGWRMILIVSVLLGVLIYTALVGLLRPPALMDFLTLLRKPRVPEEAVPVEEELVSAS